MTKPTPQQEQAILKLAQHYSTQPRPPRWHVKRAALWKELDKPLDDTLEKVTHEWCTVVEKVTGNHAKDCQKFIKDKAIFNRHIKRLQNQCKVLGEVIAEERLAKQAIHAFNEEQKRYKILGMRMAWCPTYWKSFLRLALQKMKMK